MFRNPKIEEFFSVGPHRLGWVLLLVSLVGPAPILAEAEKKPAPKKSIMEELGEIDETSGGKEQPVTATAAQTGEVGNEVARIGTQIDNYYKNNQLEKLSLAVNYGRAFAKGLKDPGLREKLEKSLDKGADQVEEMTQKLPKLPKKSTRAQRLAFYKRDLIKGACDAGFPPSIVAAQFVLESDAGKYMPANSNNPFGVKCGGAPRCASSRTREVYNGKSVYIKDAFRCYGSVSEAIQEHAGRLLGDVPGLSGSLTKKVSAALKTRNFAGIVKSIKAGGYATAPDYVPMLNSIIKSNNFRKTLDSECPAVGDIK